MKYIDLACLYKFFLFFLLSASISLIKTAEITLSRFEYAEIMKNPDASYVCFDERMSDIKELIFDISKFDKDKASPLHAFKRFLRRGFNVGLYDEVVHVLEYAELIVQKKLLRLVIKK